MITPLKFAGQIKLWYTPDVNTISFGHVGLFALFLLTACQPQQKESNPFFKAPANESAKGIVNGTRVADKKGISQHIAALLIQRESGLEACSSTLLSQNVVLTAGHCVGAVGNDKPAIAASAITVVFSNDAGAAFQNQETSLLRKATKVSLHPSYTSQCPLQVAPCADLAIVEFEGAAPTGYLPIRWRDVQASAYSNLQTLKIAGFGQTSFQEPLAVALYEGDAHVLALVEESAISIDQRFGAGGICHGDSGGPGYLNTKGEMTLLSVHSKVLNSARENGQCKNRGLLLRLDAYLSWLQKLIPIH